MSLELTSTERAILVSALRLYRINRAAQGKLDWAATLTKDRKHGTVEAPTIQARYDRLVTATERLYKRLETANDHD